jgi:hypothetical protein
MIDRKCLTALRDDSLSSYLLKAAAWSPDRALNRLPQFALSDALHLGQLNVSLRQRQTHLANRVMDAGDVQAWWLLDRLQMGLAEGAASC